MNILFSVLMFWDFTIERTAFGRIDFLVISAQFSSLNVIGYIEKEHDGILRDS